MASRSDGNEIRLTRVYDAPVQAVWDAWTVPEQAARWWGPRGFTITTHSKDLRPGGTWRYTLAEYLEDTATGRPTFVINRTFEAPRARVFEAWTRPELLARWLPPAGSSMRFLRADLAVGKSTPFAITGEHRTMRVRAEYLAIEAPERLVYAQQFVDEHEQPAAAPGAEVWPTMLLNTVLFTEEGPTRTRVTLTTEPHGPATAAEVAAFVAERSGMTAGWTGSLDVLEALLAAS